MATKYQKNFHGTMPFTDTTAQFILAASTALPYTVPGTANMLYRATFRASFTAEIWVALNATAVVPTSNTVSNHAYQEFLPLLEPKYVKGGDVLSFISLGTPSVGVQLHQVQDIT